MGHPKAVQLSGGQGTERSKQHGMYTMHSLEEGAFNGERAPKTETWSYISGQEAPQEQNCIQEL